MASCNIQNLRCYSCTCKIHKGICFLAIAHFLLPESGDYIVCTFKKEIKRGFTFFFLLFENSVIIKIFKYKATTKVNVGTSVG